MDLQTQKLNIIESLIQLNDKKLLSKIEAFLNDTMTSSKEKKKPFTKKELINRADKANKNIAEGKVLSQSKLEKASDSW
jgi:hypothetical protein